MDPLITAVMYSIVPIFIMAALALIAYMASRTLNRPEWLAFSKQEWLQVIFSIILLFIIVVGTQAVYSLTSSMLGKDPFTGAEEYLLTVENDATEGFYWLFALKFGINIMFVTAVPLDPLTNMVNSVPLLSTFLKVSATRPLADVTTLDTATDYLLFTIIYPLFSSIVAQKIGLAIFKEAMFAFVLPIGLFLRIFPGTRNAGSLMVAVAIAFYVVFPTTYMLHGYAYSQIKDTNAQLIQNAFDTVFATPFANPVDTVVWNIITYPIEAMVKFAIAPILNWLSMLILAGLFLPTLSIIITMTFIKSMQKIISMEFG